MKTELFLAWRYLKPKRNVVSIITLISIIGVALGVGVLIIVLAVMTGFTDVMKTKLMETQAHFQIKNNSRNSIFSNPEAFEKIALESGAVSAVPLVRSPVMAQIGRHLDVQLLLLGVRPGDLLKTMNFSKALEAGVFSLGPKEIIISKVQSLRWGVGVNDKILLHSPNRLTDLVSFKPDGSMEFKDKTVYLPVEFRISGIYDMGKNDFDKTVMFINIDDANDLLGMPWGSASVIYGWVKEPFAMKNELAKINEKLPKYMTAYSWMEENAALLGVLQVEKNMMFFLLIFIVLVAAFSIANTLITSVYQKTREIGILKALGASGPMIMRIFVLQGLLVGVLGSIGGLALGAVVVLTRNNILELIRKITGQNLFPKEFYYFNELPAHIVPGDVAIIIISSIALCTLGAVIPAWRAAKMDPAGALRYE